MFQTLKFSYQFFFCKFVSKIIKFLKTLQFWEAIVVYCIKQTIFKIISCASLFLSLHIFQIIVDCVFLLVTTCLLNQSHGYYLLSDALPLATTMNFKCKEEASNSQFTKNWMEDD
jgi:hypothetical protein